MNSSAPRVTSRTRVGPGLSSCASFLLVLLSSACAATIPATRYGIDSVEIEGAEQVDASELKENLVTHERDRALFWTWPWTDWPLFDDSAFERDLVRVERWYRARGFYDAKVVQYEVDPTVALRNDRVPDIGNVCERNGDNEGCRVAVRIHVREGDPVLVRTVGVTGDKSLSKDLQLAIREAVALAPGDRFDEAVYDRSKVQIRRVLANASYARATVQGTVQVDPEARIADVNYKVLPGPTCVFGPVSVVGHKLEGDKEPLDVETILGAAYIETGTAFSAQDVTEAQRAIFAIGAFSSVEVDPLLPADDDPSNVIPVVIRVTPGRLFRWGVGAGFQIGTLRLDTTPQDVAQWDVHGIVFFEFRNFLGGLRKLRIEDRPRLIFSEVFPALPSPRPGNELVLDFKQPGFIEARTDLRFNAVWDYGPDPVVFQDFFRHEFDASLGPERDFFNGRLNLKLKIRGNLYLLDEDKDAPSEYHATFLEQAASLDLRDNSVTPTSGAYFAASIHEGGYFLPSSWDYIRFSPEVRVYAPLPAGVVFAAQFGIGATWITSAEDSLAPKDQHLGPIRYRYRAGGASSNRGYLPNQVGGSINGGTREWEASAELRVRMGEHWGFVFFTDMGDVDDGVQETGTETLLTDAKFRFDYLHLSIGSGLRFYTPIGPIRVDLGFQVPGAQIIGQRDQRQVSALLGIDGLEFPGALNITIGEAF